jgi:uncharacterized integral membrane protein (TIGR00698 family)
METISLSRTRVDTAGASPLPGAEAPAIRQALFAVAALFCISPWASPGLALAMGVVLALALENPHPTGARRASKWLLQGCVVLLGFQMNLPIVLRAGVSGVTMSAATIAATFALGYVVARRLTIAPRTSLLMSAGTAICGGSAIAAVGAVIGAAEGELTVALGTVFMLNAVALYVFPPLGHALGLTQAQFGTWAGVAIHDISSVVGAASQYGGVALQTATAVKLSRSLWIIPVALAAGVLARRHSSSGSANGKLQIPWFIGLFLLASVTRSLVPGIAAAAPAIGHVATTGLTLTLFLVGAGVSRSAIAAIGVRPMLQAVILWLVISAGSLGMILWRG